MTLQRFDQQTFWHQGEALSFSGASVSQSAFNQCVVRSIPNGWNRFTNIDVSNTSHWNCAVSGCAFDEVRLDGLKKLGSSPFFVWASIFRHMTLTGSISGLKINRSDMRSDVAPEEMQWRENQTIKIYSEIDWTLDISRAKFPNGITLEAIPGDKIIRDPKTQILIRRENLGASDWQSLEYNGTAIDIAISWFETGSLFDSVVIVPRSASKFRSADIGVLEMLRREGVAEPD
jgi:hypothetical protein